MVNGNITRSVDSVHISILMAESTKVNILTGNITEEVSTLGLVVASTAANTIKMNITVSVLTFGLMELNIKESGNLTSSMA